MFRYVISLINKQNNQMKTNCNNQNAYNNENINFVRNGNCCNCDNHSQRIWNAEIAETDYDSPFFSFLTSNVQLPTVSNGTNNAISQKPKLVMTAGKTQNKIKQTDVRTCDSDCDIPDDLFGYCKYEKKQSGGRDDSNNIGDLMSNIGIGIAAIVVIYCVSYILK